MMELKPPVAQLKLWNQYPIIICIVCWSDTGMYTDRNMIYINIKGPTCVFLYYNLFWEWESYIRTYILDNMPCK